MMLLNHILGKCTAGYKLSKSQEKINHLMYINDIKLFAKNEKELETLIHVVRLYSQDIGMEFGIENYAMLETKIGKRRLTDGMELPNQEKIKTLREKETYKYLLRPSNKWRWKKKLRMCISGESESYSRQTMQQKPYQRNKYLDCTPRKIFGTILEVDQRRT